MKYSDLNESTYIASGSMPDDYFGKRAKCEFHLIKNTVVAKHSFGYHSAHLPDVASKEEALWLLGHHNRSQHIKLD